MTQFKLYNEAAPSTPESGYVTVYSKTDKKLYLKDDTGTETDLTAGSGGSGDVVGPASATDNAIALYDTSTGKLLKNSVIIVDTSGNATGVGTINTHTIPGGTGTIALTSDITGTNSGTNTGDQNIFQTISVAGQSDVVADTTSDTLTLVAGTNVTITTDAATDTITINAADSQTITLTGDVTGTGTGSFATTIADDAVTYAKMQNVSATDKLLGRSSSGAGNVEEITCTPFARSILDDPNQAAVQATIGVGAIGLLPNLNASMVFVFGDYTNEITAGEKQFIARADHGMTIVGWTIVADQVGSIVFDVWADSYANAPATVADTITGSAKPTLSSVVKNTSTTLTGWTTTINQGDHIVATVDSSSTITKASLVIYGTKTT